MPVHAQASARERNYNIQFFFLNHQISFKMLDAKLSPTPLNERDRYDGEDYCILIHGEDQSSTRNDPTEQINEEG